MRFHTHNELYVYIGFSNRYYCWVVHSVCLLYWCVCCLSGE